MTSVAQRLRQKLLDLAIHGKLVPQDPKDGSAGELLARIRKARVQLLSAKGIKKEDRIIPVDDNEIPFELPKEWTWCRFRELGILTGGHTPSMANPKFWNGDVLWVTSKDMKRKYIEDTGAKITALGAGELTMLEPGAVLMCTRSGILRRTFPVAIAAKELTINQDQRALTMALPEMAEYVYSALCALEPLILSEYRKTGTTVESIIWEKFIDMPFPLPPLAEQNRIVEKLDEMLKEATRVAEGTERLAQLRKKARAKILYLAIRGKLVKQEKSDEPAAELLKRIAAEKAKLVAEKKIKKEKPLPPIAEDEIPFVLPKGWEWCRLAEIAYVAAGKTPAKTEFVEDGVPYIKMYNLRNQKIDFAFRKQFIKRETHDGKLAKSRLRPGDLLMNIVGPPLGKLAIIPDSISEANFNQAAVMIRPYVEAGIINQYLHYYLWQMDEINSIDTKGTAGQDNISITQSMMMRIALPPLAEQHRIVAKVKEMLATCDALGGEG